MTDQPRPLVSIGIPTYNRANGYLKQTLQSAIKQTYHHIEVIVADNCSTDHTEDVVNSFGDARVRYFKHAENIGPNNNFNFAVQQARGEYFLLLHDDDLIDDDFIDVCMNRVRPDVAVGIIRTGTRVIDAYGQVKREIPNEASGLSTEDFFRGWFRRETALYLCSTLFNTKRLQEIGGFHSKHNLFQDVMAEFQLAARYGRVDIYDVKASFRSHVGELTHVAKVGHWCEDALQLLDMMCALVPKDRDVIQREGLRFLARRNYARARAIKSPGQRLLAILEVFKKFNYRYPPPIDVVFSKSPLSRGARYMRRKLVVDGD